VSLILDFIDLDRSFVQVKKDQEPDLDIGQAWGRQFGSWFGWENLLVRHRTVLLAEAASGKTAEFRHQVNELRNREMAAFFVPIEELADKPLVACIPAIDVPAFESWKESSADAWFFLDSLDEAKLKQKTLSSALKSFSHGIGIDRLERVHVYVSCRVTDWRGKSDLIAIRESLPTPRPVVANEPVVEDPLLSPIFDKKEEKIFRAPKQKNVGIDVTSDISVVQLGPLSRDQQKRLASFWYVADADAFVQAIDRHRIESYSTRPGDLKTLTRYWNSHGAFATLEKMTEYAVTESLKEGESLRLDSVLLSTAEARQGAELIAAALSLGRSWTIRTTGHEDDTELTAGALDVTLILINWSEAKCAALLRRQIFAPSSYGRVRFHHRTTQEYLTACWLRGLRKRGASNRTISDLLFATIYGSVTTKPALRAIAAWLSIFDHRVCEQVVEYDPIILLSRGDPGSIPLAVRAKLIEWLAHKHLSGDVSDDRVDVRALWMFADPALADAIRNAWRTNKLENFRISLLRMIREAKLAVCCDIALAAAFNRTSSDYYRMVALEGLHVCDDVARLRLFAKKLIKEPELETARMAASASELLFPEYLDLNQLFKVMEKCKTPRRESAEGFGRILLALWDLCPKNQREAFVMRLANMCLARPYHGEHRYISKRHIDIARNLDTFANRAILEFEKTPPPVALVRLLMAIERVDRLSGNNSQDGQEIAKCVRARPALNRALFWSDVEDADRKPRKDDQELPVRYWQIWFNGRTFWGFSEDDLPWLYGDLEASSLQRQRLALSAIVTVLQRADRMDEVRGLRIQLQGKPQVLEDLKGYLVKPKKSETGSNGPTSAYQAKIAAKAVADKAGWTKFRERLQRTPSVLSDRKKLATWPGACNLLDLSRWLAHKLGDDQHEAAMHWQELESGFGPAIPPEFFKGMCTFWRVSHPVRPIRDGTNGFTVDVRTRLAFSAIGVEAYGSETWPKELSQSEAVHAATIGCISEEAYPNWVEPLLKMWPDEILPIVVAQIQSEWQQNVGASFRPFLHRYARHQVPAPLSDALARLFSTRLAGTLETEDLGLKILRSLTLNNEQRASLLSAAEDVLNFEEQKDWKLAARMIARILIVAPVIGLSRMIAWLKSLDQTHVLSAFGVLMGRHNPLVVVDFSDVSVADLLEAVKATHRFVRPQDDIKHEGVRDFGPRDEAEGARYILVQALEVKAGAEAYEAMLKFSHYRYAKPHAQYIREMARRMLERDADMSPWSTTTFLKFDEEFVIAARTGAELLRRVMDVLDDIQIDFVDADFSSRSVVQSARTEKPVQGWLATEIQSRGSGALYIVREAEVAREKKPDFIISSSSDQFVQVAIELKHANKGWTVVDLEQALSEQLAEDYLNPSQRRHGVLVLTLHKPKSWQHPLTRKRMTFLDLVAHLRSIASAIFRNRSGEVAVEVFGLDLTQVEMSSRKRSRRIQSKPKRSRSSRQIVG